MDRRESPTADGVRHFPDKLPAELPAFAAEATTPNAGYGWMPTVAANFVGPPAL